MFLCSANYVDSFTGPRTTPAAVEAEEQRRETKPGLGARCSWFRALSCGSEPRSPHVLKGGGAMFTSEEGKDVDDQNAIN